ncbi:MAG TPA: GlmL-related ornithine degradation protein [Tissierellaceae bacterium]|nr:GlmL-related ornithine degradation protein [Tissierellaceae bacterium]
MKISLLIAEIGSTTTLVNGFSIDKDPKYIGQGQSATTVLEGDVNVGLKKAIEDLRKNLNVLSIEYDELMATSSAAGGLRMTVHGLVYDMTVKAAREAALGAGANIKQVTAGKLRKSDLNKIKEINPNIILIAGGVDYGERETGIYNSELIKSLNLNIPVIYAGNIENQDEVREIFTGTDYELFIVNNVYPRIDELNIESTREVIQDVFEKHIIHAKGMEDIRSMVTGTIMPTPGAVMNGSKILYEAIGDLMTIDIGGATTDIHSVTNGSDEIARILISPEPFAKRTVEGDLGVYINLENILEKTDKNEISNQLNISSDELQDINENYQPIPRNNLERRYVELLSLYSAKEAIYRHVGRLRDIYGPGGKQTIAEGKDLTKVQYIIGTGGPLTKLPNMPEKLQELFRNVHGNYLLPAKNSKVLIDTKYIMASLGVMAKEYPEASLKLLRDTLEI